MKQKIMVLGLILVTALFIIGCSGNKVNDATTTTEDTISIPIDSVTNQMQKLEYNAKGTPVTYFVVKDSNGKIKTAFDACDVCGGKKGYHQEGNQVVCNNCGLKFAISGLGTKNKGSGCWPSHIGHEIKDGNIIIKKSELQAGAFRFI